MGLIPARAGNTGARTHTHRRERAHPRSRGEHRTPNYKEEPAAGSSPLARGTLVPGAGAGRIAGLIPARAGNTISHASPGSSMWAHPRSRGEHGKVSRLTIIAAGSSPLARGTRGGVMRWRDTVGLIPARAGNTPAISSWVSQIWAHPRSRGEHRLLLAVKQPKAGSSPLARGTLKPAVKRAKIAGLIPARAGNTFRR